MTRRALDTDAKVARQADHLDFRASRRTPTPIDAPHEAALVVGLVSALVAGAAGYLWGSHSRQDVVFEAGYRACQVEQITGATR